MRSLSKVNFQKCRCVIRNMGHGFPYPHLASLPNEGCLGIKPVEACPPRLGLLSTLGIDFITYLSKFAL